MPKNPKAVGAITGTDQNRYRREFGGDEKNRLAMNAVAVNSAHAVAKDRTRIVEANHVFSNVVATGTATSQNSSGRCWLFAGLNPMRMAAAEQMGLDGKFELSQNYLMFWDKLEKANYFLENILKTQREPIGSRLLDWLLASPIQDGGQWDMFTNLVNKYGVIPKSAMPETESSSSTGIMNNQITGKLREYASELRTIKGSASQRRKKTSMMAEVYRMLAIHLGEPPKEFLWQWRDKDGNFHRDGMLTPQQFLKKRVPYDLDSKVVLIHCPQRAKKYNTMYTISFLGNVVGGDPIRYLNVDLAAFKKAAIDQLLAGEAVWFGCDCGKSMDRDTGVWDMRLYDYELLYGTKCDLDKAQRLDYGHSAMNHAMVFTGVDVDEEGEPTKWKVENSWGEKIADKGFFVMTDDWFDEYMYEVAVDRRFLPKRLLSVLSQKPIALPPWDPMGTLAE